MSSLGRKNDEARDGLSAGRSMIAWAAMRIALWACSGKVKEVQALGGSLKGEFPASGFFGDAGEPAQSGLSQGYNDICRAAARNVVNCQPIEDDEKEAIWDDAKVAARDGKLLFFQKIARFFKRNRENPNLSRSTADIADVADQRFQMMGSLRWMDKEGVKHEIGPRGENAKKFNEDFEKKCNTSKSGQELLRKVYADLEKRLSQGEDRLTISKVTVIREKDGKVNIRDYETVTSPYLPERAATLDNVHPDGLTKKQKEDLSVVTEAEARAEAKAEAEARSVEPVTARVDTRRATVDIHGNVPLDRQIVDMYKRINGQAYEIARPYWPEQVEAYRKNVSPVERERDAKIQDIGNSFFSIASKVADHLQTGRTAYDTRTSTFRQAYRLDTGEAASMDVQQVCFDVPLSALAESTNAPMLRTLQAALDEHNMKVLADHNHSFSFNVEKRTLDFMGQPIVKDADGHFGFADEDAAIAAIGEDRVMEGNIAMSLARFRITDLQARVSINACYNNDFMAEKQFGISVSMDVAVPDGVKAAPSFKPLEKAMEGFSDGHVHLGSVHMDKSLPENGEAFYKSFEKRMEKVFNHSAYAEKAEAREEARRAAFERRCEMEMAM